MKKSDTPEPEPEPEPEPASASVCLTCSSEPKYMLKVPRRADAGARAPAILSRNTGEIPTWYKRAGIYSPLPPPLTCSGRLNPWRAPLRAFAPAYTNDGITIPLRVLRDLDPSVPAAPADPDAEGPWFFMWAARPRQLADTAVRGPAVSYADFSNATLARARGDAVTFDFMTPVPYAVDGVPYPPHIHFARLQEDSTWDTRIWSVNVPPLLTRRATVARLIQSRRYLAVNALPPGALGGRTIPGSLRLPYTASLADIERTLGPRVDRATPLVLYCAHAKCDASHRLMEKLLALGYTNLLLYPGGLEAWRQGE